MTDFLDFAASLQVTLKALQLYNESHPRAVEAVEGLGRVSDSLMLRYDRLQVAVSHGKLFVDRKPLDRTTAQTDLLARAMAERSIGGLTFHRGMSTSDLRAFVQILVTKPQRVAELGGVGQMLGDFGVSHIRLTHVRYEELREGEEIVDVASIGGGEGLVAMTPLDMVRQLFTPIAESLRNASRAASNRPQNEGNSALFPLQASHNGAAFLLNDPRVSTPLDLGFLSQRIDEQKGEDADFEKALQETIAEFDPEMQSRLLQSREAVPPGRLRKTIDAMAPQMVVNVVAALAEKEFGTSGEFVEIVKHLYTHLQPRDRSLEQLRTRLQSLGIEHDQLGELLEILTWENLEIDAKIAWISEGRRLFEVPPERLLTFFRDVLIQQRHDDFLALVERYGLALQAESADIRRFVLENFVRMAAWSRDVGYLPAEETVLQRILFGHFLREPDSKLQPRSIDAVSNLVGTWMITGKTERAMKALMTLEAGVNAASLSLPWKRQAYEHLTARLAREHVRSMTEQIYTRDVESVASDVHPLLAILGAPAAAELIEQLGVEDDRANRGRLIRAVKAIGRPALIPLRHSLNSPTWYLVRNTLNLLGDIGAVELVEEVGETLRHQDGRVRRAAARALSKIGGERAEALLIEALGSREDAELQSETLFCLGSMRAEAAVIPIAELTRPRRMTNLDEATRKSAVDVLGQIGSARAVPFLEELLKKRALLGATEPPDIRLAAAKALSSIATPEAKLVIRKAIEHESNVQAREQMVKLLEGHA